MAEFYRKKKKICQMCAGKSVDYKDAEIVKKYVSADKGKILPRRVTISVYSSLCAITNCPDIP